MRKMTTALLAVLCLSVAAQKPEYGSLLEAEYRGYAPHIVGEDEESLFAMDYDNGEITIESFDKKSLRSNYRKVVEMPSEFGVNERLEGLAFIDGQFVYFMSMFFRKEDSFQLWARPIDAKSGRLGRKEVLFSKTTANNRDRGFYNVEVSKNNQSILVHTASYYDENNRTVENMKLFDKEFNEVLEKEYVEPGEYKNLSTGLIVDDEGSAYFLQGNDIVILDAFADYEEWREPITIEGVESNGSFDNVYASLTPNQDLVVVGSYITKDIEDTDENKDKVDTKEGDTQVEGMFYLRLDGLNKELAASKLTMFDQDYVDQFLSEENIEDGEGVEINNDFSSFRFFYRDNGELVFVGEQIKIITHYSNGAKSGESRYYKDLAVYHFNTKGDLKLTERIPKSQRFYYNSAILGFYTGSFGLSWMTIPGETRQYFSYTGYFDEDKFHLLFNDSQENIGRTYVHKEMDEMKKFKKSIPVVHTIDLKTGHRERELKKDLIGGELWIKPNLTYQKDGASPLYFFSTYKKDYKLGRIEI